MKSNIELIEDIKRDKTKREFFLKKVKDSIEKYSFNFTNQELEELLDEAIENYNDSIKITLIFYLTAYIKKRLEEKKGNQEKSKLFTWEEIAIINQYLENNNGQYQYLAVIKMNNKFIDIDVNAVIKKFKNFTFKLREKTINFFMNHKDKQEQERILKHTPDNFIMPKGNGIADLLDFKKSILFKKHSTLCCLSQKAGKNISLYCAMKYSLLDTFFNIFSCSISEKLCNSIP